jgi:hypothetical protein
MKSPWKIENGTYIGLFGPVPAICIAEEVGPRAIFSPSDLFYEKAGTRGKVEMK